MEAKYDARKKRASRAVGHYASLWVPGGSSVVATTITDQRKSHAREIAARKRVELLADIARITGVQYDGVSRKIDGTIRRWTGVKSGPGD